MAVRTEPVEGQFSEVPLSQSSEFLCVLCVLCGSIAFPGLCYPLQHGKIGVFLTTQHRTVIQITVNGTSHSFDAPLNVTALVEHLDLAGKRIAVERNGEIVPRSQFGEVALASGDKLEIVVAVGGG
jgi:sulfur carrier protein